MPPSELLHGRSGRVARHLALAAGSTAAAALIQLTFRGDLRERVSSATAYVAIALLAVTLSLGPLNVLRGRPNPVSFNLRRDFGIWSAIVGVFHAVIGLTVHFRGRMFLYFLPQSGVPSIAGLRRDVFGLANDTGVIAALLLLILLAISNDISLRKLGTARWRRIQRWAYALAALAVLHAVLYQAIEKRRALLCTLAIAALAVLALQLRARSSRHDAAGLRAMK